MRVLILAAGPPAAGGKGYQVRLYNQVLRLAGRHELTLLTFAGAEAADADVAAACRKVIAIPLSRPDSARAALLNSGRLPLTAGLYRQRRMAEAVRAEIGGGAYQLVHVQLVRMAPYLAETAAVPSLVDLMDAAELSMRERARAAPPGIRQVYEVEAGRLGAYERETMARAGLSILISERDFAYLGSPSSARVLPNGIEPELLKGPAPPRDPRLVMFTGTMSYFPNIDAARWLATEIWPLVRAAEQAARLEIVGRAPVPAVLRLGSLPGVTVTGAVAQVAAELARATVAVCPIRLGSGMLTKVLEAMAVGTPVVGTGKALEGLPEDLRAFLIRADSPAQIAAEVARILADPAPALKQAQAGLEAIRRAHTWARSVSELERLYREVVSGSG